MSKATMSELVRLSVVLGISPAQSIALPTIVGIFADIGGMPESRVVQIALQDKAIQEEMLRSFADPALNKACEKLYEEKIAVIFQK